MRKATLLVLLVVLVAGSSAQAAYIKSISGSSVDTSFTAASGELNMSDTISVVIKTEDGLQSSLNNLTFSFKTYLTEDNSVPGKAVGLFSGGSFSIHDDGSLLLGGSVGDIELESLASGMLLGGGGMVNLDNGSLLSDIRPGYNIANAVQLMFDIGIVTDFNQSFAGNSNLTITPIPEPATLAILALGSLVAIRQRRLAA